MRWHMRVRKFIPVILIAALCIAIVGALSGCGRSQSAEKDAYYCPMHPTYTSDKPGDCPICNMKLVRREKAVHGPQSIVHGLQPTVRGPTGPMPVPAQEKTLAEVCIEHHCTMKNCPMMLRANIKPGERLLCPVCGEVISTASGKVVEISGKPPAAASAATAISGKRKILYYRNPMTPESTSPVPVKDSMGMDYVPVYEEVAEGEEGPGVYISPEKQQLIGVKIERVKKMKLEKVVRATGKIAYDPELFVTQEEFIQALQNEDTLKASGLKDAMGRAQSLTEAARRKLKLFGMSDDQIAQLEKTRKADRSLYLPLTGESVWAYLAIYEYEIGLVKVGDIVELSTSAYPGEKFQGKVASISPVLDPMTRTNQVRVEVANREDKLKPEMFVNAVIHVALGEKLAVPESAVLDTGVRKIVYLERPGGYLESREVRLGQKAEGYHEVLEGLSAGDSVVTSGNFLIDSESRLKSSLGDEHSHGQ